MTGERAEGPLVAGVAQAAVAGEAGQHDAAATGGLGDRRRAGVVLARLGAREASPVITELAQHPGAEDRPESWQGADDLGVRVLLKMLRERRLEFGDLGVEACDQRDGRAGDRARRPR